jgi:hypothetical protein
LQRLGGRYLPPDPTSIVQPLFARPRKLRAAGSDREWLLELCAVYERCARAASGKEVYAYRGGRPEAKTEDQLLAAARRLVADELAPEAWCAASIDQFEAMAGGKNLPRPVWVWSANRLAPASRSRIWFEDHRDTYQQPRQLWPEGLRELHRDWTAMMSELRICADTREVLYTIVDAYFPREAYDRRLQACREAAMRLAREQV